MDYFKNSNVSQLEQLVDSEHMLNKQKSTDYCESKKMSRNDLVIRVSHFKNKDDTEEKKQ